MNNEWVRVVGPASLSNLGPGFDALGLALSGIGDTLAVRLHEEPGVIITEISGEGAGLPLAAEKNIASVAAAAVLEKARVSGGLEMRIEKGIRPGSGIGSSAASAVAGAWAANVALGEPFTKPEVISAILAGEVIASGSEHGDNILPALFGGLVLVSASDVYTYRRVAMPSALPIALILPEVQVLTKEARAMLPANVSLRDAVHNASSLAFMMDAFRAGDWETVGRFMMQDRLVEPVRATLVPCYQAIQQAALDAGAFGCALSGSGPAMFAVAESEAQAEHITQAMLLASCSVGIGAQGQATKADSLGARTMQAHESIMPMPVMIP